MSGKHVQRRVGTCTDKKSVRRETEDERHGVCVKKIALGDAIEPDITSPSPFHQRHSRTISFIEIQTTIQRWIDLLETDEHENEQLQPRKLFAGERLQGVPSIRLRIVDTSRAKHSDFKSDLLNPFFRH